MSFFPPSVQARGCVIPNPVLPPPPRCAAAEVTYPYPGSPKRVISVGRLTRVKRFDRLISAFQKIKHLHPDWSLEIWGEGPEQENLQKMIDGLELTAKVRLCGLTDNVYQVLAEGHLFALTSETEGFPMALCEAMACGLPVVSMDCPSGPRQIIRPGVDGVLTPDADVESFAGALDRLMGDPAERRRLAGRAPEVVDRFGLAAVMKQWEALFLRMNRA